MHTCRVTIYARSCVFLLINFFFVVKIKDAVAFFRTPTACDDCQFECFMGVCCFMSLFHYALVFDYIIRSRSLGVVI